MLYRLFSIALLLIGSGLFNTFVALRLEMEGYPPESVGALTAALYGGILVGSWRGGQWVQRVGHLRSFAILAFLLGVLVMVQALWVHAWFWGAMRFLGGMCIAGITIVIESWLMMRTDSNRRGVVLSLYLISSYIAISCGQLLFSIVPTTTLLPYSITAFLMFASIISLAFWEREEDIAIPTKIGAPAAVPRLGLFGSALGGATLASIYGLVPLYAKQVGLPVPHIGYLMAVVLFGGLCLQFPVGYWSDRVSRRLLLVAVSFSLATCGLIAVHLGGSTFQTLSVPLWFFGGFACTLYPISLAYSCESMGKEQVATVTGKLLLSFGLGAITGPLIAPLAMRLCGPCGLFYFLAGAAVLFSLFAMTQKRAAPTPVAQPIPIETSEDDRK